MSGRHALDVPTDPLPVLPATWSILLAALADPFTPRYRLRVRARPPVRHGRLPQARRSA